jgi:hypothetical protein
MHHHRWPSFFLDWDRGGGMPHVRYPRPDGTIRDTPSKESPVHAGTWSVQWMNPEPMHAIEVVETPRSASNLPDGPPLLRIEIKCHLSGTRSVTRLLRLILAPFMQGIAHSLREVRLGYQ